MTRSRKRWALITGVLITLAVFAQLVIGNSALEEPAPAAVIALLMGLAVLVVLSALFAVRPSKALGRGALVVLWILTCGISFSLGTGALQGFLERESDGTEEKEMDDPISRVEKILTSDSLELELETFPLERGVGLSVLNAVVEVPERSTLLLAIAVDPLLHEIAEGMARFILEVEDQNGRSVLGDWRLKVGARGETGWRRVTIDMGDYAGQEVRLRLRKQFKGHGQQQLLEPLDLRGTDLLHWSRIQWTWGEPASLPSVILVSIDTLRADHLGFMGYGLETSPRLDRLAGRGTVFESCISQAPWTAPAHAAIMTGLYPHSSGSLGTMQSHSKILTLPAPTLSGILAERGFETVAFTGRGPISARYGLRKGFQYYSETEADNQGSDVALVVTKARAWLAERRSRSPFFLFLHTFEPHAPYASEKFLGERSPRGNGQDDRVEEAILRYDGDIRLADESIGRFLEEVLENHPRTLVVITSDHGEDFLEGRARGFPEGVSGHGHSLFDELLHVPLLILGLGEPYRGLRVAEQVRSIDIAPTLLDLLGVESPSPMEGESLLRWIESGRPDLPALSEGTTYGANLVSMRFRNEKLIERISYGTMAEDCCRNHPLPARTALYDLSTDQGETNDLAASRPETVRALRRLLEEEDPLFGQVKRQEDSDSRYASDIENSLRTLGYIE